MGEQWETHSISYLHNTLMPAGTSPEILYDNGTNHTKTMSRRETTAYTALLPAGSDNEAVVIYGLLRYWTVACNHSSGILAHCYNHSIHGSEIRANYGFAMRITRQLKIDDVVRVTPPCAAWEALSRATIVVDTDAPAYEKFAAAELAGQLAGFIAKPPLVVERSIVSAADVHNGATIAVGLAAARRFGVSPLDLSPTTLGPEGFVASSNRTAALRAALAGSYALAGTQMATGPVNSSHGTLFAVHHLLRLLGVRYLAHDAIVYPVVCPRALPVMDVTYRPQMEQRNVYTWGMLAHGLHAMRSHM